MAAAMSSARNCARGNSDHAGQRGGDGTEAGEELGDEEGVLAPLEEEILGAAHARVRLEGDAAEQHEHAIAPAPAELVPDDVRGQGARQRGAERERDTRAASPGQGPDAEERGHGGDWQTDLLGEDEQEQQDVSVLDQ
jgi:hypothetical protein